MADAVCGAVYNAISRSRKDSLQEIEVYSYDMLEQDSADELKLRMGQKRDKVIIPPELKNIIDTMEII